MKKTILLILALPMMMLCGCENANTDDCIHAYGYIRDESLHSGCFAFSIVMTEVISDPIGELTPEDSLHSIGGFIVTDLPEQYRLDSLCVEVYCRNIVRNGYFCNFSHNSTIDLVKIKQL